MPRSRVAVGVSDHAGWAVLVTAESDGTFVDRRRVELVDEGMPVMPHHHDAQGLPIEQGVALVERVRASAERNAKRAVEGLAKLLPGRKLDLALRELQPLPPTVAERLQNYRAQNVADWVMYRAALANAAESCGFAVVWYDPKTVVNVASSRLGLKNLDAHFARVREIIGPPWDKDHKLAMAAAIVAASSP